MPKTTYRLSHLLKIKKSNCRYYPYCNCNQKIDRLKPKTLPKTTYELQANNMTLLNTLMKNIDKHVHQLIEWIEQTYEVDANEISAKWKEISGSGAGKTGKAQHVNSGLDPTLCQHTFRVGNNAGMQCGVKPKDGPLCSSHKPKSRASSNEKTVDIVDGALNPIYCNFEVGERKQCGVKPKAGGLCSIHRNGAPKIKTVPLVDGVVDPMFCNRKLSETTQCGVKPKTGNYCSSHREPIPKTPSSSKSEKTSRKLKSETDSDETDSEPRRVTRSQARKLTRSSDETDSEPRRVTRSQARKLKKSDSDSQASSEESEISESDGESDGEDEPILKDAISRAKIHF